jgi:hypothetical protein
MKKITKLLLSILTIISISCKKEEKDLLIIPTVYEYDSINYATNVQTELNIRLQLAALTTYMKKGDNVANKLVIDSLNKYFSNLGNPTLKSITPTYYSNLIENTWFASMVTASQNAFDIADASTSTTGGVYVNRLLDSKGAELLQIIEKGMYFATLYNHFITLTQGTITETSVDRMICIFGAHPSFPNTNTLANTSYPDAYIALYTARRDRLANNSGLYRDIKRQFIKLKAAVKAGSKYDQEKNEAISALKLLMEKAIFATVINYINGAKTDLDIASPTANDKVSALHELSECVGFVHGFKALAQSNRKITDTQINQILAYLKNPIGGSNTMYLFGTSPSTSIADLDALKTYIKNIYNFSDTEMNEFNYNWISTEGR